VRAQDPRELFDVVLADGTPTGTTKERALVHRDGDWHRAVHVWVYGVADEEPFVLFQRRGLAKDTMPGRLDPTVGGYLAAGEGVEQALREVEEEIGVVAPPAALRWVGTRRGVNEAEAGVRDRELQAVFLLRDDRPLTAYRPHPVELAGLVRVPLASLLAALAGDATDVPVEEIAPGAAAAIRRRLPVSEFERGVDRYVYRVAIAAAAVLRGERHVAV